MANSELGGLIKIAESLRIKGLGDVSQRDPGPTPSRPEKRAATPYSPPSPTPHHNPRPRKAARISSLLNNNNNNNNNHNDIKSNESDFASLLSPANSYGHAMRGHNLSSDSHHQQGFAQLMESANHPVKTEHENDAHVGSPAPSIGESKLRSCLEGQDSVSGAHQLSHLLVQPTASRVSAFQNKKEEGRVSGSSRRKNNEGRSKASAAASTFDSNFASHQETDIKSCLDEVKQECSSKDDSENHSPSGNDNTTTENTDSVLMPHLQQLYDAGERTGALMANYIHLLGLHQQKQEQEHQNMEENSANFTQLIPTAAQENQASPNKDMKVRICLIFKSFFLFLI